MRLCDLNEIKTCVERQYENCHGYSGNKKAIYLEAILAVKSILHSAKPIDAVPVVRCRECKYSRINHLMKKDILSCENIDVCGEEYLFERNPNDFCSYGEREEGADNG